MREGIRILTNNPLAREKWSGRMPVEYRDVSYREILRTARDWIHKGDRILTHPLYGSVKPGETPYRSLLLRRGTGETELRSLRLIESALAACDKFEDRTDVLPAEVRRDYQVVDLALLASGIEAAETRG